MLTVGTVVLFAGCVRGWVHVGVWVCSAVGLPRSFRGHYGRWVGGKGMQRSCGTFGAQVKRRTHHVWIVCLGQCVQGNMPPDRRGCRCQGHRQVQVTQEATRARSEHLATDPQVPWILLRRRNTEAVVSLSSGWWFLMLQTPQRNHTARRVPHPGSREPGT